MKNKLTLALSILVLSSIIPSVSLAYGPFVPDTNTVFLWHFDEPDGSVIYDSTSNHYDSTPNVRARTAAKFGNGLTCQITQFGGHYNAIVNGTFTVEGWIKAPAGGWENGTRTIVGMSESGSSTHNFFFGLDSGKPRFGFYNNAGQLKISTAQNAISDLNGWVHVACIYDLSKPRGSRTFYYVNGVQVSEGAGNLDGFPTGSGYLYIGKSGSGGACFSGKIDEVRLSNTVRIPTVDMLADVFVVNNVNDASLITSLNNCGLTSFASVNSISGIPGITNDANIAKLIILDGHLLSSESSANILSLRDQVYAGRTVLVTEVLPAGINGLRTLINQSTVTLSAATCYQLRKKHDDRLLRGISGSDLCFIWYDEWGGEYNTQGDKYWPVVNYAFDAASIAGDCLLQPIKGDYKIRLSQEYPSGYSFTDNRIAMTHISYGSGYIIICQIQLAPFAFDANNPAINIQPVEPEKNRSRILSAILSNLGVRLEIPDYF